jgi:hypothetical protein
LDVAKLTTLTPLSLLVACGLSFPIVVLKMSSLPTLALKSPNKIVIWYFGNLSKTCSSSSLPQYAKLAQFVFCFGSSRALCFCDCNGTFSHKFVLCSFLCSMSFIVCISVCFPSAVILNVCSQFNIKLILDSLCS